MPRLPRPALPNVPMHIVQRGNNRQPCFAHEQDYRIYLDCLRHASLKRACAIHAYVLMTNHVHLLATGLMADSISRMMQDLGRGYVGYFNAQCRRTGTLWEGRFKAAVIDSDRYLWACHRYIELNPVRARMVASPIDYPWTSHHTNAFGSDDPVVSWHPLYLALGAEPVMRQTAYRHLFESNTDHDTVTMIRQQSWQDGVIGDPSFCQQIETNLGRRATQRSMGRPRKCL